MNAIHTNLSDKTGKSDYTRLLPERWKSDFIYNELSYPNSPVFCQDKKNTLPDDLTAYKFLKIYILYAVRIFINVRYFVYLFYSKGVAVVMFYFLLLNNEPSSPR